MLFDSPAECFRVSEGLPFFASVEAIVEKVPTINGAEQ
jgi:hypothetical protein